MRTFLEKARTWSMHESARLVLRRVLIELERDHVRVLPVKGILTARLLYSDPSERPIQDIDLRVCPSDLDLVRAAGARAGWHLAEYSSAYGQLSFIVDGILVEFESHVGPRGLTSLTVEDVLSRARACREPFGFTHLQPELHDHVLLMLVNAFKDKMFEAHEGALRDLELFAQRGDFDPLRLATLAAATRLSTLTVIASTWMAEERREPRWGNVANILGRPPRPLYASIMRRAFHQRLHNKVQRAGFVTRLLTRAASDSRRRQVVAICTMARWLAEGHRRQ